MRKILILLPGLLLALAGVASADTPTVGGEFELKWTGDPGAGTGLPGEINVSLDLQAADWNLEVALEPVPGVVDVADYRLDLWDERFDAIVYRNRDDVDDKATPFDLIKSESELADTDQARVAFKGLPVTVDAEAENLYVFAETALEGFTVGGALQKNLDATLSNRFMNVVGYGKATFDPVTIEAAFGTSSGDAVTGTETSALGVKGSVGFGAVTTSVEMVQTGVGYKGVGTDHIKFTGTYDQDLVKAEASLTQDTVVEGLSTIEVVGLYRGSADNVIDDDLFETDQFMKNVAPAAQVTFTTESAPTSDPANTAATTEIDVKATAPVMPDTLWALLLVNMQSDDDNDRNGPGGAIYSSVSTIEGRLSWKVLGKATLTPRLVQVSASAPGGVEDSSSEMGVKLSYPVGRSDAKVETDFARTTEDVGGTSTTDDTLTLSFKVPF